MTPSIPGCCARAAAVICLALVGVMLPACAAPPETQTATAAPLPSDLGSMRHATVALPTDGGRVPLTFLAGPLPEGVLAEMRAAAPNVRIIAGLSRDEALKLAPQAHGIDGRFCTAGILDAADRLCWVQALSAGVDRYLAVPGLRDSDRIVFTNMQGVHGPTIADHVFGMLLTLTRDLRYYLDDEQRGTWDRDGSGAPRIALEGRTLFVVGLGGIGREVAQRGKGFGMRVLATRRSATPPPSFVDRQGTPDDSFAFLRESDVVVLCVPLTEETRGMIGAEELALLRPGSYLINIARGPVVDTEALVDALQSGRLAGAGLDVTDPEPLPGDHVLWSMDNVLITPHVSSRSELTEDRRWALYIENMRRFGAGEPLLNVVDRMAGY
ncbi:MAG: D-2-hydroxyacid dehydrogenase [Planctomycetota bacterium]|nr:D-2-hydroxyacid dehydrogenase [Planctomycetota bacterium]